MHTLLPSTMLPHSIGESVGEEVGEFEGLQVGEVVGEGESPFVETEGKVVESSLVVIKGCFVGIDVVDVGHLLGPGVGLLDVD